MVRTFNLLRTVGKFDNVAAGAQRPFDRLTVVYAENARGKTTLAAILRSLASVRAELVSDRARLPSRTALSIALGGHEGYHAARNRGSSGECRFSFVAVGAQYHNRYSGTERSAT